MTWQSTRLKWLCVDAGQYGLNVAADQYSLKGRRLIRTSDIDRFGRLLGLDRGVFVDLPVESRHQLAPGDILLSRSGTIGRSMVVDDMTTDATYAGYLVRFRPSRQKVDPRFLAYVVASDGFQARVQADAVSSTIQNFNAERYANLPLMIPSASEQCRIANYLDIETRRIEELLRYNSRLISVIAERIDSRIRQAIGKSCISVGGWADIIPVKRVLKKMRRPLLGDREVVTAYRDGQVRARGQRRAVGYTLAADGVSFGQGVSAGDVVIHGLDGFAGAIGESESDGNCSPVYHVCTPTGDGDSAFYGRLLRTLAVEGYFDLFATSTRERAVDFRNWDRFGNIPIPHVEMTLQKQIGDAIRDSKPLHERTSRLEGLLLERRYSLITAAVTGQIDVSTASGVSV